ncbi:MAG: amino acid ABC transporter permease [Oscillospiraceae bacterium]|nr:amino acid ABC transporter permease [Oscillospiraceae bacterium]MCI9551872.1 amino acid ABC transporter permease [Oscillospiraceae bacterium]
MSSLPPVQWLIELGPRFYTAFVEAERWKLYLKGLGVTFQITVAAISMGLVLGLVVAMVRTAHDQQRLGCRNLALGLVNAVCKVYTTVIRGTPMMVQILIWNFVIFKTRNKILVGMAAMGINAGAYISEIIRGGLMSVDSGQSEAGRSLGLSYFDTMRFIVIPQAFKNILPSMGNELVTLFKDTSLVNTIGAAEMTYYATRIGGKTFDYMPPLLIIAAMYLVFVMGLTWLQGRLERRLRQSDQR